MPCEIFFSYSHKDEELRDQLAAHLVALEDAGEITAWHDRRIGAGTDWAGQIDAHLQSADIILLLVSADFIASRYCKDVEVAQAMARHAAREARVIPVIMRPCQWMILPFGQLQALPKDAQPITLWSNRDTAWLNVIEGIRVAVAEIEASKGQHATTLHDAGARSKRSREWFLRCPRWSPSSCRTPEASWDRSPGAGQSRWR